MDVAVTELRAHLSDWLQRARQGDEVVITDRGVPVARLLGLSATAVLERLAAEGGIGQAGARRRAEGRGPEGVTGQAGAGRRPAASGHPGPRPRRPVADIVSEQRR